uniref:Troponin I, fast skeletal muscle n=1 Tax=Gasterosteus aculeatus aculeatus TaxID=481459 RepID=A0AAQ4S3J3_GASAC
MSEKKMSSSRKHHLKSLMLSIAKDLLEEEEREREKERERYMKENCPPVSMPRSMQELQELCREIHHKIDVMDEERYDLDMKVNKSNKEIDDLKIKVQDLMGKFKKPVLRKVRMSADAMLKALLGSKHTVNMDLRANLKQVKKEVKEERYSIEFKLNLVMTEVRDLNIKIVDMRGKFKRPRLKKVRMSADAMLKALLGSKHTVNMDLRANLKQVKKEVKEEDKQLRDVGDWRKNIEDKSDRKKMFDS